MKNFLFLIAVALLVLLPLESALAIHGPDAEATTLRIVQPEAPKADPAYAAEPTAVEATARQAYRSKLGRKFKTLLYRLADPKPPSDKKGPGSGMAVAGLVCGIVGLVVAGLILGTLATVFGAISLSKYRQGLHGRKGMAIAALILGIVGIIGALIAIAVMTG